MSKEPETTRGTGDWARGLTPAAFWRNAHRLQSTPEPELRALLAALVSEDQTGGGNIYVGSLGSQGAAGDPGACRVFPRTGGYEARRVVRVLSPRGRGNRKAQGCQQETSPSPPLPPSYLPLRVAAPGCYRGRGRKRQGRGASRCCAKPAETCRS